ncbi:MAG: hypothetical protein LBE36_13605 [Flavobacteriaceae bacterium]|jgi:hypothetical protein|nr:hypothetical protein [Flavobacteriaceae bacterium]
MPPKGNFIAYQPLRPVESKIGDITGKFIDDLIKRGDAEKAAKAKAMFDANKSINDTVSDIDLKYGETIPGWQDQMNAKVSRLNQKKFDIINMPGDTPEHLAEKERERAIYQREVDDFLQAAIYFNSETFKTAMTKNREAKAKGELFEYSPEYALYTALESGIGGTGRNEYGMTTIEFPNSVMNPFGEVEKQTETMAVARPMIESVPRNTANDTLKTLQTYTPQYTTANDEYRKSGLVHIETVKADEAKARDQAMGFLGFDTTKNKDGTYAKNIQEQVQDWVGQGNDINAKSLYNKANVEAIHLFASYAKRLPKTAEDFESVVDFAQNYILNNVDETNKTTIKKTNLDLAIEQASLTKTKQEIEKNRQDIKENKVSDTTGTFKMVEEWATNINTTDGKVVDIENVTRINLGKDKAIYLWRNNNELVFAPEIIDEYGGKLISPIPTREGVFDAELRARGINPDTYKDKVRAGENAAKTNLRSSNITNFNAPGADNPIRPKDYNNIF